MACLLNLAAASHYLVKRALRHPKFVARLFAAVVALGRREQY